MFIFTLVRKMKNETTSKSVRVLPKHKQERIFPEMS